MNSCQTKILDAINDGNNVFFTGPAGSGKSFMISTIIQEFKENSKKLGVLSSTGTSAIKIGGTTVHGFFGIIPGLDTEKCIRRNWGNKNWKTDAIIIDEVSMISADLFTQLDTMAKRLRRNYKPFGGIQVIVCGDFFQLPPVQGQFCFESEAWKKLFEPNNHFKLTQVYRQTDSDFVNLLGNIRTGRLTDADLELLCCKSNDASSVKDTAGYSRLYSTNKRVDYYNNSMLEQIDPDSFKAYSVTNATGTPNNVKKLLAGMTCPQVLSLAPGVRCMLIRNTNIELGLVNGLQGTVMTVEPQSVKVKFDTIDAIITVSRYTFELVDTVSEKTLASVCQIPLVLSWAVTIHKSQGASIEKLYVDCESIFSDGQFYVGISRAKDWNKLILRNFDLTKVKTNQQVLDFDASF